MELYHLERGFGLHSSGIQQSGNGKGIPCYHQGQVGQRDHGCQWDQQDQQHRSHQEDHVHPTGDSLL